MNDEKNLTYNRHEQSFGGIARLYGSLQSKVLQNAHICVIGIGGVGSWAVEALARSGVGELTLIDMDDICVTNINRQIHALISTVGENKVEVMAQRVKLINPDCKVNIIDDFISPDNQHLYLTKNYDYVLDAIDSIKAKSALLAYCVSNKIKVITIGGAGGQIDPTKIQIADLARSFSDPLTKKIKNTLRRQYNFSKETQKKFGIECVFSSEQLKYPQADGSVCQIKTTMDGGSKLNCTSGFGATTIVTASFAFVACARIIEKILAKYEQVAALAKTKKL